MSPEPIDFTQANLVPRHDQIDLECLWKKIDQEVARYVERTPKSAALFEDASECMVSSAESNASK